jgi:hypothetical protein
MNNWQEGDDMKRCLVLSMVLAMICLGCAGMKCHEKRGGHMMEKRGMWSCCPMHREMGMMMMKRTPIATQDGGIALLMGNKLVKYDKDMNLQKEIELKYDTEGMHKMMDEMCAECPMCGKMWGKRWKHWKAERREHEMEEHEE